MGRGFMEPDPRTNSLCFLRWKGKEAARQCLKGALSSDVRTTMHCTVEMDPSSNCLQKIKEDVVTAWQVRRRSWHIFSNTVTHFVIYSSVYPLQPNPINSI